jgi:hypothetical protein
VTGSDLCVPGVGRGPDLAEIERQQEDIILSADSSVYRGSGAATAQSDWCQSTNLKQWLAVHLRESGPACEMVRIRTRSTVWQSAPRWNGNNACGTRSSPPRRRNTEHSASLEAGNSPKMINKHHREPYG